MQVQGRLRKMLTQHQQEVSYQLRLTHPSEPETQVPLNPLLGQQLSLEFSGDIHCIHCDRKTSKSFSQGYCYPCFKKLAQCDTCIIKPETCHYHQGTCREPAWGEAHCFQPHSVYLANTSGLKVGITRQSQMPTRWMDQGAVAALPLLEVKDRLTSGQVEILLAQRLKDKTAWQAMLKNQVPEVDLLAEATHVLDAYQEELANFPPAAVQRLTGEPLIFKYPVLQYPSKIKSLNPEKTPQIEGQLLGIKGQYLLLDTGVINLRKFAGYVVAFTSNE
ncbi:Protein of unknown function [Marinospirillum celere]|uniref:DUF2797 domain-containing protein n=1 Tax=Marinospirillum celere TaxID=1122252 RepID=A0A1I1H1J5_9GAMM|nr:DUF2797 domain-containing protein [Marinospirillum celere]SFC15050.1 Protein of unknown function [Marinospirillum celere]